MLFRAESAVAIQNLISSTSIVFMVNSTVGTAEVKQKRLYHASLEEYGQPAT